MLYSLKSFNIPLSVVSIAYQVHAALPTLPRRLRVVRHSSLALSISGPLVDLLDPNSTQNSTLQNSQDPTLQR